MTKLTTYEYDVFLSHNHANTVWTEQLALRLEQDSLNGQPLRVFYSERDIRPGQSIPQRIQDALTKSRKVALILSPEAVRSRWVELEYLATLYSDVSEQQEHLIPLMHCNCELPYLIAPLRYIDFREEKNFERAYRELLATIKDEPLPQTSESTLVSSTVVDITLPQVSAPSGSELSEVDEDVVLLKKILRTLRQLEQEELIDESMKQEYQRRVLDKLVNKQPRGHSNE